MIRFIWQNWWRRKERFFLILVGVLIISVGLTYLVGLSEMNRGTIVDELQKRWKSSYDIVVRPKGTQSITEETGLLDPNYLSGISGGITMEQYETIKNIPNVDVAAPIATIVDLHYYFKIAPYEYDGNGIYRLNEHYRVDDGIQSDIQTQTSYIAFGDWDVLHENFLDKPEDYPIIHGIANDVITNPQTLLLAAIDPEQEAKLVGLDKAIIDIGNGRYFNKDDKVHIEKIPESDIPLIDMPIIISNRAYSNHKLTVTFEKLDIPFEQKTAEETLDSIMKKGGETYLDKLPGGNTKTYSFTSKDMFKKIGSSMAGFDIDSGKSVSRTLYLDKPDGFQHVDLERPSALQYTNKQSPYSERWPFAYQLKKIEYDDAGYTKESFREMKVYEFNLDQDSWPYVRHRWIGFYDPTKLNISRDPTNELPMETYRPASTELVLDKNMKPVNPPITLKPSNSLTNDALDFIAEPPALLTTLEAAEAIIGDKPISAIRIRVKDVTDLSEDSQAKIEKVADEIER
ncbi:MAG TPA: ABC transporter permease, partial [Cerasibacillus sp.]